MNVPTIEQIKSALERKGYQYFNDGGLYDLNIIGIRSESQTPNSFNDLMCVLYNDATGQRFIYGACTTKPGSFYLLNPDNPLGTAILVPGQYVSSFATGLHHGQYECLVQVKTLQLYRDGDKDNKFDYEHVTPGGINCGIHIHRASPDHQSTQVDNWSAGCQVIAAPPSFQALITLVNLSKTIRGNSFSYTLLNEADVFPA